MTQAIQAYFTPCASRRGHSALFYRIAGYSPEIAVFFKEFYAQARQGGVLIDGRLPNPDPNQLSYFQEMLGTEFRPEPSFLEERLNVWLPRMTAAQRKNVSAAMFSTLEDLRRQGKNDNILKNAYIKYFCWLYYKFERITGSLGAEQPPKILFDGTVSSYELQMLAVLHRSGADVVLLERDGDAGYQQIDPQSVFSQLYPAGDAPFPEGFGIRQFQAAFERERSRAQMVGSPPKLRPCTNAWMEQASLKELTRLPQTRGTDAALFYNGFVVQYGVEDPLLASTDFAQLYQAWKSSGRRCSIQDRLPPPTPEEVASIRRGTYQNAEQALSALAQNLSIPGSEELTRLARYAFFEVLQDAAASEPLGRLTNQAVSLLCWMQRVQKDLLIGWKPPEVSVFLLMSKSVTMLEVLFLRLLARLPVDVVVLLPDQPNAPSLNVPELLELRYSAAVQLDSFPTETGRVRTAAYQAERELDSVLYQDSGLYRNQQYAKADAITLQPMYEEIELLWNQEVKYRPGFAAAGDTVTVPVLLEKVCGVKDGQTVPYWASIRRLVTPETVVIDHLPWLTQLDENPIKPAVTQFLQNGRLQRQKIRSHPAYPYGILREEMQQHLLDKLQLLLDSRLIRGTYENGTEYAILAAALNLHRDLVRQLQKFDFTKKNPKLMLVNTAEKCLSLEDSITLAYLHLLGFDLLFWIPTGYQCIEAQFQKPFANEHQLGSYQYDLIPPRLDVPPDQRGIRKFFGRRF